MKCRSALALVLVSGTFASAQDLMVVSTNWTEMVAGTNTPILAPNGVVEPGEGAMVRIGMYATRNGTNAIGQNCVYTNPPGPVTGTIRGIGSFVYDLEGSGADASGTWTHRAINTIFNFNPNLGQVSNGGARITALNSGQWLPPGTTANSANPIEPIWRGVWNPNSYETRVVHFDVDSSVAVPTGQQNAMDLNIGTGFLTPGDPTSAYPIYVSWYMPTDFGAGVDIPVGQGPGLALSVCYPNCDTSSGPTTLNANDILCYINLFSSGSSLANCDGSNRTPLLTANDLMCYLNKFAAGCQ